MTDRVIDSGGLDEEEIQAIAKEQRRAEVERGLDFLTHPEMALCVVLARRLDVTLDDMMADLRAAKDLMIARNR